MAARVGATNLVAHEEFEPYCKWQREDARDTLILEIPDFKKEQLRVHINNRGILKLSGERSIDASRKSKFYKEVVVPRNCDTNGIQAKFAHNQLFIVLPKLSAEQINTKPHDQQVANTNINSTTPDQRLTTPEAAAAAAAPPHQELGTKKIGGKKVKKMVVNAGMVITSLAVILAFVVYMYKATLS